MNRGNGPQRRTRMRRTAGPERRTRLEHGESRLTRTPLKSVSPKRPVVEAEDPPKAKSSPKPDRVPARVRRVVLRRCGGECEVCGLPLPEKGTHIHHRLRRSQGGEHEAANLIAAHPLCHVSAPDSIHERPGPAQARGLLILRGQDPAERPLTLPSGARVLLHPTAAEYVDLPGNGGSRAAA